MQADAGELLAGGDEVDEGLGLELDVAGARAVAAHIKNHRLQHLSVAGEGAKLRRERDQLRAALLAGELTTRVHELLFKCLLALAERGELLFKTDLLGVEVLPLGVAELAEVGEADDDAGEQQHEKHEAPGAAAASLALGPGEIGQLDRGDQAVVDQLDPGPAAAGLGPDDALALERVDQLVGEPGGGPGPAQDLVAGALGAQQALTDEATDPPLAARTRHRGVVEAGQGLVGVAWLGQRAAATAALEAFVTGELQLHRLDAVGGDQRELAVGEPDPALGEVAGELLGVGAGVQVGGGAGDRLHRRRHTQTVEGHARAQAVGEQASMALEVGEPVVADRQQEAQQRLGRADTAILQALAELAQEGLALLPLRRVGDEQVLELVEDDDPRGPPGAVVHARRCAQVRGQRVPRQRLVVGAVGRPVQQHGVGEDVAQAGGVDAGRQQTADARERQYIEAGALELGDDARADQRGFAGAARTVEYADRLGDDQRGEVLHLARATEEAIPLGGGEGAGSRVWTGGLGGLHA